MAPFYDVIEAFERISHIFIVKEVLALFSPGNQDIFSTSPLFLAVACPGADATVHGCFGIMSHLLFKNVKEVLALFELENLDCFNELFIWRLAADFDSGNAVFFGLRPFGR